MDQNSVVVVESLSWMHECMAHWMMFAYLFPKVVFEALQIGEPAKACGNALENIIIKPPTTNHLCIPHVFSSYLMQCKFYAMYKDRNYGDYKFLIILLIELKLL